MERATWQSMVNLWHISALWHFQYLGSGYSYRSKEGARNLSTGKMFEPIQDWSDPLSLFTANNRVGAFKRYWREFDRSWAKTFFRPFDMTELREAEWYFKRPPPPPPPQALRPSSAPMAVGDTGLPFSHLSLSEAARKHIEKMDSERKPAKEKTRPATDQHSAQTTTVTNETLVISDSNAETGRSSPQYTVNNKQMKLVTKLFSRSDDESRAGQVHWDDLDKVSHSSIKWTEWVLMR